MAKRVPVPVMLKHCAYTIFDEGGLSGSPKEKFIAAFAIARSRLVEYGFLKAASKTGDIKNIALTGRGALREVRHRTDGNSIKTRRFDELYAKFIEPPAQKPQEKKGT